MHPCRASLLTVPVILLLCSSFALFSQSQPRFIHLTSNEGLSQDHVSAILKDKNGFMWFASDEGLNKYDGYEFTAFKHDLADKGSISSNYVLDILEDHNGNLWVGTTEGLDMFNREKNSFTHYSPKGKNISVRDIFQDSKKRMWIGTTRGLYLFDQDKNSFKHYAASPGRPGMLSDDFIYRIAEGTANELWIGTREGLNMFDPETEVFFVYKHDVKNKASIGTNRIKAVYRDRKGNIWIGTQGGGVGLYDRDTDSFKNFYHNPKDPRSLSHNDILSFAESRNGDLWIGTENGGISVYDYKTNSFSSFRNDLSDNSSLSNNSIYSLYQDDVGNMWVGTWSGGVNMFPRFGQKFQHYRQIAGNPNSLSSNIVLSITGDNNGDLWIGTDGGGLNFLDWESKTFKHYKHDINNRNSISTDYVLAVHEINKDILAIGYHRGGFDMFNRTTGKFVHHMPFQDPRRILAGLSVHVIYPDKMNNLWIGTFDRNGLYLYDQNDLYRYDGDANKYIQYSSDPANENSIGGNIIYSVFEDSDGNLWVGTDGGLELFDRKKNTFTHHRFDPNDPKSISHNVVYSIMEDRNGNLWLGTGGGGLNFFDKKTKTFTSYTEKNGLPNNFIYGILEDRKGNLWFSSNRGLSKFNPFTKTCRNYTVSDGLQANSFKPNSCYKNAAGLLFFGGTNGFNVIDPENIEENTVVPPVYITDFQIFNEPVKVADDSPLKVPVSEAKSIVLSPDQSVFTFEYAALSYSAPEKNQYAYKLEGFDRQWNYVGSRRTATYTNLDPGEYNFRVKASNNDGVWNETGTSIKVVISPPYWKTLSFQIVSALLIAGVVFGFYKFRISSIQKQKARLKRKVKKRTIEIMRKNEEIKSQANEIKAINQNLEQLVSNRTMELERKNKALERYAFITAHKLRGPLASILGLIHLMSRDDIATHESKIFLKHLGDSADKLDVIIHSISEAIEDVEISDKVGEGSVRER
jgi:ligand-binding sensor domain-containing protein